MPYYTHIFLIDLGHKSCSICQHAPHWYIYIVILRHSSPKDWGSLIIFSSAVQPPTSKRWFETSQQRKSPPNIICQQNVASTYAQNISKNRNTTSRNNLPASQNINSPNKFYPASLFLFFTQLMDKWTKSNIHLAALGAVQNCTSQFSFGVQHPWSKLILSINNLPISQPSNCSAMAFDKS